MSTERYRISTRPCNHNETTLLQTHHKLGWKMNGSIATIDSAEKDCVPLLAVLVIH
jgi:hypothetical protein